MLPFRALQRSGRRLRRFGNRGERPTTVVEARISPAWSSQALVDHFTEVEVVRHELSCRVTPSTLADTGTVAQYVTTTCKGDPTQRPQSTSADALWRNTENAGV
jgi:hypothetical protein